METLRTRVGIVGAGPAGLLLSQLLHLRGIESVVLESRSRGYVEQRVRAGVLEHGIAELLERCGAGDRLRREGLVHTGVELLFDGCRHRLDFAELTGKAIVVYGQQEVVKDLIALRLGAGAAILFEAPASAIEGLDSDRPSIRFSQNGEERRLECDVIAGCDGFHGVSRLAPPEGALRLHVRDYPYGWLGILARVAPANDELIYCRSERGFALLSMRSPEVSRLYLQVAPDEPLEDWPDDRIWDELRARLRTGDGWTVTPGPIFEKGVTAMRGAVVEPMRYGPLFLAGDAAHIVPPTGAKGLNLAAGDVRLLAAALGAHFEKGDDSLLDAYSDACLGRAWLAEEFSAFMTATLHTLSGDPFEERLAEARLRHLVNSREAAASLAERYVDLNSLCG